MEKASVLKGGRNMRVSRHKQNLADIRQTEMGSQIKRVIKKAMQLR